MSAFEIHDNADCLTLLVHRDFGSTPWWVDCYVFADHHTGGVNVQFLITDLRSPVTCWHFSSFEDAMNDRDVRNALLPVLNYFHQTLPTSDAIFAEIVGPPKASLAARQRIGELVDLLDCREYRTRRGAREALGEYTSVLREVTRTWPMSCAQRGAVRDIARREVEGEMWGW